MINTALPHLLTHISFNNLAPIRSSPLPEVLMQDASGVTLEIYRSIEASLGVRLVNLVYRHLATVPGALEWAWAVVGQGFQDQTYRQRATALVELGGALDRGSRPVGVISLQDHGLTAEEANAVVATLDAYNRANPMNALSLRVIALGLDAGWRPPAQRMTVSTDRPLTDLLPMGSLENLDRDSSMLMSDLALFTTGEKSNLVPSLFRHFTTWPSLLAGLRDWLKPMHEHGMVGELSVRISEEADRIANDIFDNLTAAENVLAAPDDSVRNALSGTIAQFLPAICRMIVIGGLLRRSIRESGTR